MYNVGRMRTFTMTDDVPVKARWTYHLAGGRYAAWKGDLLIGELFKRDGFWWIEYLPGGKRDAAGSTLVKAKAWLKDAHR